MHVLFWSAYLAEDTLLAYFWDGARYVSLTNFEKILLSLKICAALMPPKMLFTYLLLYIILDRVLQQKSRSVINIFYLLLAIAATIFLLRVIDIYFIFPFIYQGLEKPPAFFSPFGLLFDFIDLGFVSGMAITIRQLRLQFAGLEREKMLLKEKLEAELKFLKNQTNPHFLFNTLNNIYALARKRSDHTADAVMKLSKILRFMLYESGRKFISIEEEIRLIDDYIDLEKIRYNENLQVFFEKNIDNEEQEVSPLLLLPFVENAFKHGVNPDKPSAIEIRISIEGNDLSLFVSNKKVNLNPDTEGIGVQNSKTRLQLLYAGKHKLSIKDEADNYIVDLLMTLE